MNSFFNIDGPFFTILTRLGDLILLNVIWLLCCIPIVTIGASTTALYYSTMKLAGGDEGYLLRNFFKSFKQNFLQSTIIWLIMLLMAAFLVFDSYLMFFVDLNLNSMLTMIFLTLLFMMVLIWLLIMSFVFPLQSKFENKIKYTIKNSLILSIRHLPWSILIIASFALAAFVFYKFSIMFPIFLFIGFAAICYGHSYIYNKLFNIYIHKNETTESHTDSDIVADSEAEIPIEAAKSSSSEHNSKEV